jgi:hypothetical protein
MLLLVLANVIIFTNLLLLTIDFESALLFVKIQESGYQLFINHLHALLLLIFLLFLVNIFQRFVTFASFLLSVSLACYITWKLRRKSAIFACIKALATSKYILFSKHTAFLLFSTNFISFFNSWLNRGNSKVTITLSLAKLARYLCLLLLL